LNDRKAPGKKADVCCQPVAKTLLEETLRVEVPKRDRAKRGGLANATRLVKKRELSAKGTNSLPEESQRKFGKAPSSVLSVCACKRDFS